MKLDINKKRIGVKVSAVVSVETKECLHEIAFKEDCTVSDMMRKFIEKGVSEYGRK